MFDDPVARALAVAGLAVVVLGVGGLAFLFGAEGLDPLLWVGGAVVAGPGPLALSILLARRRLRSRGAVSFRLAVLAAAVPALVTLGTVSRLSVERALSWGGVVAVVFAFGLGLAFTLGTARTTRQRWVVVAGLAVLGELFVSAAVLDWNTHLEAEGLATLLAVAAVPVLVALGAVLYRAGATTRRALSDDEPARGPLPVAVALPWVVGALARVVPPVLDAGPRGLSTLVVTPLGLGFLAVGAASVYAVDRRTRPATA